jgi:hypothetical protein
MNTTVEYPPTDLHGMVKKIAVIVQQQQSGIVRFERENIETTTQQLAELVTSLRSAGVPDATVRGVMQETLAVISTNLALLRALKLARERLVDYLGGSGSAGGLLVNRIV